MGLRECWGKEEIIIYIEFPMGLGECWGEEGSRFFGERKLFREHVSDLSSFMKIRFLAA
jgi:hypothetical protein